MGLGSLISCWLRTLKQRNSRSFLRGPSRAGLLLRPIPQGCTLGFDAWPFQGQRPLFSPRSGLRI